MIKPKFVLVGFTPGFGAQVANGNAWASHL